MKRLHLSGAFLLLPFLLVAQELDINELYFEETIKNTTTIVAKWDNDLLVRTDRYYTNGAAIQIIDNRLRIALIDKILKSPLKYTNSRYGIEIQQKMYTPERMFEPEIQYGDRPYAGVLTATYSHETYSKNKIFNSSLTIGVVGPAAGASYTQSFIHSLNDMREAAGWQFQVKNGPVLNLKYEFKNIFIDTRYVSVGYKLRGQIGSLATDFYAGTNVNFGLISSKFGLPEQVSGFEAYLYANSGAIVSLYDATIQGNPFAVNPSDYLIQVTEKKNLISNVAFGMVLSYNRISFKGGVTFVSPEFAGDKTHGWGSIVIAYTF